MAGTESWQLTAGEIARRVRARELSAEEATRSALARIDAVNGQLNAIVESRPEEALARAREIDARIARGEDVGPLAGVPVTTKVNIDQAGYATTNGLRLQKELVAQVNSPPAESLLAAGAVLVGRTNTPAFSYRWFTGNSLHGRTLNPHDASITPGGSSGGAASAVASGMCALGHGTDIAGSIRYPAYACGIQGLRPSLGRVAAFNPTAGVDRVIGGQIMAVSGPLARSIADLRLGLQAMARPDARDPWWVPAPLQGAPLAKKVALCLRPDGMDTQADVVAALQEAASRLRDAGYSVEEVDALPPLKDGVPHQVMLWMGDGYDGLVQLAEREGDPAAIAALAGQAALLRGTGQKELSQALIRRAGIARAWQLFMEQYPLVLLPICTELPFEQDADLKSPQDYERVWSAQLTQVALPLTGLPALSVNVGKVDTRPVGVQLVAPRYREDWVLAAGEAIEARGPAIAPVDPAW